MARHRNSVSCMHRREDGPRRRGRAAFMQRLANSRRLSAGSKVVGDEFRKKSNRSCVITSCDNAWRDNAIPLIILYTVSTHDAQHSSTALSTQSDSSLLRAP